MTSLKAKVLEPCPFCGGKPSLHDGGPGCFFVQCDICNATSDDGSQDSAISRWNSRSDLFETSLPHAGKVSEAETILREELRFYSSTEHGSLDGIPFKHVAHVLRVMLHRLSEAALSSQQAEAVPVAWRYDIQYGPDGEANYAWVYDEHNNLVCTAKTHHAIAIVQRASSPAPADAEEPSESAQIKPLVWHGPDFEDEYWAYELDKAYTIGRHVDQGRWLGGVGGYFPSVEAAKAAAQADFEARIRSAVPTISQAKGGAEVEVSIKPMKLSDGRCDYFVSFRCGDREVTPHAFRQQFKAEYHVALYRWLFGQGDEPDPLAFDEGDWPARKYTAEEQHAFAALRSSSPVGQTAKEGE